jgi:hypothetical protein
MFSPPALTLLLLQTLTFVTYEVEIPAQDGFLVSGAYIPPGAEVPVFPREDLEAGRDGVLEKALAILSHMSRGGLSLN